MATLATTVSLNKLSGAVTSAVKAAADKHKLQIPAPTEIVYLPYWICGFPLPDPILSKLGSDPIGTLTAVSAEVGKSLQAAAPELVGGGAVTGAAAAPVPAVYIRGGHIICGIWIDPPLLPQLKQ